MLVAVAVLVGRDVPAMWPLGAVVCQQRVALARLPRAGATGVCGSLVLSLGGSREVFQTLYGGCTVVCCAYDYNASNGLHGRSVDVTYDERTHALHHNCTKPGIGVDIVHSYMTSS